MREKKKCRKAGGAAGPSMVRQAHHRQAQGEPFDKLRASRQASAEIVTCILQARSMSMRRAASFGVHRLSHPTLCGLHSAQDRRFLL